DARLTRQGTVIGTRAFPSPEQAGGDPADARSDIYSLGALAYFLLTGQPPFAGRSPVKVLAAHLHEPPPPVSSVRADVPPELEAVVLKCLSKAPADRFRDVRSLGKPLAECEVGTEGAEEDATAWWQFRVGSEVRCGSNECQEKAGRTGRGT